MNEATKVKIIGGLVVVGTALAGYLADLAAQGQFGMWSAVVGALAGAALTYLASKKAMTMLALFLAFVLSATACQAACRHITPMPSSYPADGQVILGTMSGEVDSFWSTPITVRYGNYDWPADNGAGVCGGKGWLCLTTFSRRNNAWTIHKAWEPNPVLFDPHTGRRLP